jgi:TetR/AcrR family transcriptional regulator, regulator of cefoperazone and chloramphenicol sensitivity
MMVLVVDYFAQAIAQVPVTGTPAQIAAARDAAVQEMLAANPAVVNYLRRAVLNPTAPGGHLLERLAELARREVTQLRATGFASTTRPESSQVIDVVVRQLGHLFLQPMIDAMWRQLAEPGATDGPTRTSPPSRAGPATHRGQATPEPSPTLRPGTRT